MSADVPMTVMPSSASGVQVPGRGVRGLRRPVLDVVFHDSQARLVARCRVGRGPRHHLQARNGQFVGSQRYRVRANSDVAGRQERFTLMDTNGGCVESGDIVFLSTADGDYLRSYGDRPRIDARGTSTGPWERFVVSRPRGGMIRSRDTISLQTAYGYYVAAAQGGGGVLNANQKLVGPSARSRSPSWSSR